MPIYEVIWHATVKYRVSARDEKDAEVTAAHQFDWNDVDLNDIESIKEVEPDPPLLPSTPPPKLWVYTPRKKVPLQSGQST